MVKKAKAKSRLDKYYHMAKEQGYRSRAAFKLIQLNKKFDFLSTAHVLIDLCAAPGGWLQVAVNNMPVSGLILGVDLAPIKPIKGATTFVGDITTKQCYARVKSELKHLKADVVIHDGAPNVGVSWEQDSYSQNELVLSSLKLATQFLREGGVFVTKVFRSVDYNSLLWVFNKLFGSVTATKPMASRNASAEIFVVCERFSAPKSIDPKLLDPRYVFMESEDIIAKHNITTIKQILEGKRVKIDQTKGQGQFRKTPLNEFIDCQNPFQFLADNNEIDISNEASQQIQTTFPMSEAVKDYCKDIKLLGKTELKLLIKYRNKVLSLIEHKNKPESKEIVEIDSEEELDTMIDAVARKDKRKTKKHQKLEKKRSRGKTNLEDIYEGQELFTTQDPNIGKDVEELEYTDPEDENEEEFFEDDDEMIEIDDTEKIDFMEKSMQDYEDNMEKARKRRKINEDGDEVVLEEVIEESMKKEEASRWFQRKEFEDLDNFNQAIVKEQKGFDEDEENEQLTKKEKKLKKKQQRAKKYADVKPKEEKNDFEVVPQVYPEELDEEAMAETIALGTAMLRKKRRREIINSSYNKYNFEDPNKLPDWFEKDQKRHYTASLPVTREEMAEARKQLREFNNRPSRKVLEAIGRRKKRLAKKLESLKPKAEAIANQTDISESIKLNQLQKLYKKEITVNKPKKQYIVSRNFHKDRKNLRKGGRNVRFVDKRLKKDKRADKLRKKNR